MINVNNNFAYKAYSSQAKSDMVNDKVSQKISPDEQSYKETELYQKISDDMDKNYINTPFEPYLEKFKDETYALLTAEPPKKMGMAMSYGMQDNAYNGTKNIYYYTKQNSEIFNKAWELLFKGDFRLSDLVDKEHFGELFTKEFASEAEVLAYAKKLGDDRATWIDSVEQPNFENLVVDMSDNSKNSTYNPQPNSYNRADEIERNNRMLLRKYNGAKSKNLNTESKNEILKTFFEEFLKNNNPLAFLEIMKKTDIRA